LFFYQFVNRNKLLRWNLTDRIEIRFFFKDQLFVKTFS
jgi:hypothetical protein